MPKEYDKCKFTTDWCNKYGNGKYLAKTVIKNPTGGGTKLLYENIEFVPNIVDFQVVFKDREGNEVIACALVSRTKFSRIKQWSS